MRKWSQNTAEPCPAAPSLSQGLPPPLPPLKSPGCPHCSACLRCNPGCDNLPLQQFLPSAGLSGHFFTASFPVSELLSPLSHSRAHLCPFLLKCHHPQKVHPGSWIMGSMLYCTGTQNSLRVQLGYLNCSPAVGGGAVRARHRPYRRSTSVYLFLFAHPCTKPTWPNLSLPSCKMGMMNC